MVNTFESSYISKQKTLIFIAILIGIFLQQSHLLYGVNFSLADFFCFIMFVYMVINNKLQIPLSSLLFFSVLSFIVLFAAVYYIPANFNIVPDPLGTFTSYLKLFAVFIFFIVGYNLSDLNLIDKVVKWYAFSGLFIGVIGVLFTVLNINAFSGIIFDSSGIRFKGLMNDPNYFAILQITALVYFTRSKKINNIFKLFATILISFAILISGSKTGFITLICYLLFRILECLFQTSMIKKTNLIKLTLSVALLILIVPILINIVDLSAGYLIEKVPSLDRVQVLITDFNSAISNSGSDRTTTWNTAIELIKLSPILGIGVGTYIDLGTKLFGVGTIAHNTYLQLLVEWGIPLTVTFFTFVFYLIVKSTFSRSKRTEINLILRDMIIILLIGSLAISLNNARIFWLCLGALLFNIKNNHCK